jgi:hypothetical protein
MWDWLFTPKTVYEQLSKMAAGQQKWGEATR